MKKITAYIFLSLFAVVAFAQDGVSGATEQMLTKSLADSFYMINDYKEAIYIYEQLLQKEGESADVYYNLGNSYYKSDEVAKAILNYERALLLSPADKDVEFNLAIAKSKTVDKVNEPYELFFISWSLFPCASFGVVVFPFQQECGGEENHLLCFACSTHSYNFCKYGGSSPPYLPHQKGGCNNNDTQCYSKEYSRCFRNRPFCNSRRTQGTNCG